MNTSNLIELANISLLFKSSIQSKGFDFSAGFYFGPTCVKAQREDNFDGSLKMGAVHVEVKVEFEAHILGVGVNPFPYTIIDQDIRSAEDLLIDQGEDV